MSCNIESVYTNIGKSIHEVVYSNLDNNDKLIEGLSKSIDISKISIDTLELTTESIPKDIVANFNEAYLDALDDGIYDFQDYEGGGKTIYLGGEKFIIPELLKDYITLTSTNSDNAYEQLESNGNYSKGRDNLLLTSINKALQDRANNKSVVVKRIETTIDQSDIQDGTSIASDNERDSDKENVEEITTGYGDEVDALLLESKKRKKSSFLDKGAFNQIYFKDNESLHNDAFSPYIKRMFVSNIFRTNVINGRVYDMAENAENTLSNILLNIKKKYQEKGMQFPDMSGVSDRATLVSLLKPILLKNIRGVFNKRKDLVNFTSQEKEFYYDFALVMELESVVENETNFIQIDKESSKRYYGKREKVVDNNKIVYSFTDEVINMRKSYDDSKNGDKNSSFIKALIESTKKYTNIYDLSESEIFKILTIDEDHIRDERRDNETIHETIERQLGTKFILIPEDSFISYDKYKALLVSPEFMANSRTEVDMINFLKNNENTEAISLYNMFFSPDVTYVYNPLTDMVESQSSIKTNVNKLAFKFDSQNNIFTGKSIDIKLEKVLAAFTMSLRSMSPREMLGANGSLSKAGDINIRSRTYKELMQGVTKSLDINTKVNTLSNNIEGKVTLSKGILINGKQDEKHRSVLFLNVKVDDNLTHRIPINTEFTEDNKYVNLDNNKKSVEPDPNTNSSVISVNRNIDDPTNVFQTDSRLKTTVGIKILESLGFPKELTGYIVNAIDTKADDMSSVNERYRHDFTNFVANYAMMIALNDSSNNINEGFLEELHLLDKSSQGLKQPNSIKKINNSGREKLSTLRYDPYTYLWAYKSAIVDAEIEKKGVGNNNFSIGAGKRVSATAPSNNHNLELIKATYADAVDNGDGRYKNNDFINGKLIIKASPFKTGMYNPVTTEKDGQKNMTYGNKLKQIVETNFLGAVSDSYESDMQVANVQSTASESSLITEYNISKQRRNGKKYKFIPLVFDDVNNSVSLNERDLQKELIDKNKGYYTDIINTVQQQYNKVFNGFSDTDNINSVEVKDIITKFQLIDSSLTKIEVFDLLRLFNSELSNIKNNTFYMHELDLLLKKYNFKNDFLDLIKGINNGIFYDSSTSRINKQLLYDIDLWFNQMSESDRHADYDVDYQGSYTTPTKYLTFVTNEHIKFINKAKNKTRLSRKAVLSFKKILKNESVDINIDKSTIKDIIYRAYHYQEMMIKVDTDSILYGDIYNYISPKTSVDITSLKEGKEFKNVNWFMQTKLRNDNAAYTTMYKRVKPLTLTGGDSLLLGDRYLSDIEHGFIFNDPETVVKSLGFLKDTKQETFDGVSFIFPFAAYMRDRSSAGEKYGYNVTGAVTKDITVDRDPITGSVELDKKATHNMFNYETMDNNQQDFVKRFNEAVSFSTNGEAVEVLVPGIIDSGNKVFINPNEVYRKSFKNIEELFEYLGGRRNENLFNNAANIMLLEENSHIKGKYASTIGFPSSRKTGSGIINPSDNLFDSSKPLFSQEIKTEGIRIILDLTEKSDENHTIALGSQSNSALYSGTGTNEQADEVFKALSSIQELDAIKFNDDILALMFSMVAKGPTRTVSKADLNIINEISKKVVFSKDVFADLIKLAEDTSNKFGIKAILHKYYVNLMNKDLTKKSDDTALKEMLEKGGDINGQLNGLFRSILNTYESSALSVKVDGANLAASQLQGIQNLYGTDGKSKRLFMLQNSTLEYSSADMSSKNIEAFDKADIIYVDDIDSLKNLGINKDDYFILNSEDDFKSINAIRKHKYKNSLAQGNAKAIITDIKYAKYADFAIMNNSENISIIKDNKDGVYKNNITILDNGNKDDVKLNNMIDVLTDTGVLVYSCK